VRDDSGVPSALTITVAGKPAAYRLGLTDAARQAHACATPTVSERCDSPAPMKAVR